LWNVLTITRYAVYATSSFLGLGIDDDLSSSVIFLQIINIWNSITSTNIPLKRAEKRIWSSIMSLKCTDKKVWPSFFQWSQLIASGEEFIESDTSDDAPLTRTWRNKRVYIGVTLLPQPQEFSCHCYTGFSDSGFYVTDLRSLCYDPACEKMDLTKRNDLTKTSRKRSHIEIDHNWPLITTIRRTDNPERQYQSKWSLHAPRRDVKQTNGNVGERD
jgi:hypothetical protein